MQTAIQSQAAASILFLPRTSPAPAPGCSGCHLKGLCLPCGLAGSDVDGLDGMMFARRRLQEGQALYHEGEEFRFLFAVRRGTFKSTVSASDGREQVTGFHMAGEFMGLDGVAAGSHASATIALEDAEVCAIPYPGLMRHSAGSTGLQQVIARLMSAEIVREHGLMMLLGSRNAEERLAGFLLNISQRMKARGYSATEFHLRMSRADIGSYLGMKFETVSRTFSAFQQQRLLVVDRKHVRITDPDGLARAFEERLQ
ncbi:MAG: fnr [Ramlibacter sp.]|nr:fnr [Ramlibacter sp.]